MKPWAAAMQGLAALQERKGLINKENNVLVCDRHWNKALQRQRKEKALNSAHSCQGRLPRGGDIFLSSQVNRKGKRI